MACCKRIAFHATDKKGIFDLAFAGGELPDRIPYADGLPDMEGLAPARFSWPGRSEAKFGVAGIEAEGWY